MATIATVKQLVQLCRAARTTLFIWGIHGIGKSSVVRQVAQELDIGFVDLRCAQLDSVDLRGFPARGEDGRTHFLPPAELPSEGAGILFLDELNRAGTDVLAAAFQLVLDRAIGEYRLPDNWSIVCAGNFRSNEYDVTELDAALCDRFCHVIMSSGEPTLGEWIEWMGTRYGDAAHAVVDFCGMNLAHLEDASRESLDFVVKPSRRSWEAVVRGLQAWDERSYSEETRHVFVAGLVGLELAVSFLNYEPMLKPTELLAVGVRRAKPKLRRCERHQLASLMWGLISLATNRSTDKAFYEVLLDFAEFLSRREPDLAMALCDAALAKDADFQGIQSRTALLANPKLAHGAAEIQAQKGRVGFLQLLRERPVLAERLASLCAGV